MKTTDFEERIAAIEEAVTRIGRAEFGEGNRLNPGTTVRNISRAFRSRRRRHGGGGGGSWSADGTGQIELTDDDIEAFKQGRDKLIAAQKRERRRRRGAGGGSGGGRGGSYASDGTEEFGDTPGHTFRGNQYTDGGGADQSDKRLAKEWGTKANNPNPTPAQQREMERASKRDGDGFAEAKKPDTPHQAELRSKIKDAPISEIASVIRRDWGEKVNYGAKPYLDAMGSLDSVKDNYGQDRGDMIVAYFLSNATGWRGETAAVVKDELKSQIKR